MNLCNDLDKFIKEQGFELWGATPIESFDDFVINITDFYFKNKFYATMEWLKKNLDVRIDPKKKFPQANTIVVVAKDYSVQSATLQIPKSSDSSRTVHNAEFGFISNYALGDDYHSVMGEKLRKVADFLLKNGAKFAKYYVDTGPVFEKYWAAKAGIGWIGKNSLLISRSLGSFLFLGVILTDLKIAKSQQQIAISRKSAVPIAVPSATTTDSRLQYSKIKDSNLQSSNSSNTLTDYINYCGSCTRCIDACPTNAIVADGIVDSNKCIAYLTVEHRGTIQKELQEQMGGWVFGCDICQDVCPWNIKAEVSRTRNTGYRKEKAKNCHSGVSENGIYSLIQNNNGILFKHNLLELLEISEKDFNIVFRNSPVKRAKWEGFIRNVMIAIANLNVTDAIFKIKGFLTSSNTVLRSTAEWAIEKLQLRS